MGSDLSALRARLARIESGSAAETAPFRLAEGAAALPLARGALHEVFAAGSADAAAAAGFALGLAAMAAEGRPILWVRQEFVDREAGLLSGLGLAAFGIDPALLVAVRAHDAVEVLKALAEGARCRALGAAIGESWGNPPAIDLTATRRLALAARDSGVTLLMIRLGAEDLPSAASTRWRARALPSRPLEANAPGPPAFALTLLRRRAGQAGDIWNLEWDRDRQTFRPFIPGRLVSGKPLPERAPLAPPLPGAVAAVPAGGSARDGRRKAG